MNSNKSLNKLIEEFISEMDSKQYVQKNNKWVLDRFITWMIKNEIPVRNPRRADIIHYKQSLLDEGKTPTTINRYLAPVRTFFAWLEKNNIYSNIAGGIRSPKPSKDFLKDYLTPKQIIKLLDLIPKDSTRGLRDYAMINLIVCTGLRRVEILRMAIQDVILENDEIVIHIRRKGRVYKERMKIEKEIYEPIEKYLEARGHYEPQDPLFSNYYTNERLNETTIGRIIKNYLRQVSDSKKLTCHSLRHSAAINLLSIGKSIYDVKNLLGHRSIQTTQLYLKAIEEERIFNNPLSRDLMRLYKKGNQNNEKQPENE